MKAAWAVSLLIILYLVAQWLMLRPHPEDRRRMRLREQAQKSGWQVRLLKPPAWWTTAPALVARYSWPCPQHALPRCRFLRDAEGRWQALPAGPVPALLQRLRAELLSAVECESAYLHVYWDESGEASDLAPLPALIDELTSSAIDHMS